MRVGGRPDQAERRSGRSLASAGTALRLVRPTEVARIAMLVTCFVYGGDIEILCCADVIIVAEPSISKSFSILPSSAHAPLPLNWASDGIRDYLKRVLTLCAMSILLVCSTLVADEPKSGENDRTVQAGVPEGKITSGKFTDSKLFSRVRRATTACTFQLSTKPMNPPR
jgi:hypothetical protein